MKTESSAARLAGLATQLREALLTGASTDAIHHEISIAQAEEAAAREAAAVAAFADRQAAADAIDAAAAQRGAASRATLAILLADLAPPPFVD